MAETSGTLLDVQSLAVGYGKRRVLHGVDICVGKGEIVAVIGHNGAGKSTLLKTIFGLVPLWGGHVRVNGCAFAPPDTRSMLRAGVSYLPQGNRVFGALTVEENLGVAGITIKRRQSRQETIERVLAQYPALAQNLKRKAVTLSGGERQMLALAMLMVLSPKLMLLDEPSLGLAPPLAIEALHRFRTLSRRDGVSILIVEQKVREVLKIADRVYVIRSGAVLYSGGTDCLAEGAMLREMYL